MKASELVTVARIATRLEPRFASDAMRVASVQFEQFKRKCPELLTMLTESERSDRQIGDWIADFLSRWETSGMSLKNFADRELFPQDWA